MSIIASRKKLFQSTTEKPIPIETFPPPAARRLAVRRFLYRLARGEDHRSWIIAHGLPFVVNKDRILQFFVTAKRRRILPSHENPVIQTGLVHDRTILCLANGQICVVQRRECLNRQSKPIVIRSCQNERRSVDCSPSVCVLLQSINVDLQIPFLRFGIDVRFPVFFVIAANKGEAEQENC